MKKAFQVGMVTVAVAVAGLLALPCEGQQPASGKKMIAVKGSDTMVNLSAAWAEAFMKKTPEAQVSVTGGGSGVGISALLNGTTDICNSSRDVSSEEKQKGVAAGITVTETNVALDGIAIVVNPGNPMKDISLEQLKQIYTGAVSNWKEINGQDAKIIVLCRETSSGTYVFFQEHVLQKQDYTASARLMPATAAIIESVANDAGAIGYVGLGYAVNAKSRVKVLPVKKDAAAVEATEDTVRAGKYPIARPLHCYTNGKPKGLAGQFLDFCLSDDGQKIVREQGFVPLH